MNFYKEAFKRHSAFTDAIKCAIVIGLGDLVATGMDIYWLIGDMKIQTHSHHYLVFIGLSIAFLTMVASFIWLHFSVRSYVRKKIAKEQAKYKRLHTRIMDKVPTHCNVTKKKIVYRYKPEFYED